MPRVKLFDEQEVLEKAMNLFWKQGYSATSIQDLVNHLGINRASIYDTFGDKEELFLQAFQNYRRINKDGISRFLERESDVKSGLQKLFKAAIEEAISDQDRKGCFVVNTTTELIPGDGQIAKMIEENQKAFESVFLDYLEEGDKAGQFSSGKDLRAIATLLFTLYNGIKVVSKVSNDQEALMKSVDQVLTLLD